MRIFKNLAFLAATIFALTPIIWFAGRWGVLINGVDTNFPLDPAAWFERRLYVWDGVANAGRDFSSSTAGLFFHLIQVIPYKLGLNLQVTELTSLLFWFLLIVFSSYFFSRLLFPGRKAVQLLFVVLYSFNIYLFNTWENVKVANLALVSAIPVSLYVFLSVCDGTIAKRQAFFASTLIGIVLSGSGINPAYFFSFFLPLTILFLGKVFFDAKRKDVFSGFLVICLSIVAVNLFWILPTGNFILRDVASQQSIDKLGFTNWVDSLSENTSLLNVMRLQGAWDWYAKDGVTGLPLYIPYVLNFFQRFPFLAFSFLLPLLAFLALIFAGKKRYLYISFGAMFILGSFLGAGTHSPTGVLFSFLGQKIPFFSILRSPWYIFTPLVFLSVAFLVSMFFARLFEVVEQSKKTWLIHAKRALLVTLIVLVVGNLLYSYPLITGKIFRPGRNDSFFVKFPNYIYDAKKWLSDCGKGRIVGYPDDEIEQFDFGYRGIESVVGLLSSCETVFSSLNAPDSSVAGVLKGFYLSLKKGEVETAKRLAAKLNIAFIFVKEDQNSLSPDLPQEIKQLASNEFGSWRFYQVPENSFQEKIYSPREFYFGSPYRDGEEFLGLLDKNGALVNPQDSVVNSITEITESTGYAILPQNLQAKEKIDFVNSPSRLSNRLLSRDLSTVIFEFEVDSSGSYQPVLERYKLEVFGVEVNGEVKVKVDGEDSLWEIEETSEDYVYFKEVSFSKGKHQITFKLENKNLIVGGDFNSGVTFKKGGYGEGLGEYKIIEDSSGKYLEILNVGKANVSADFPVLSFNPITPYYVELKYKQIYGNNAAAVITQGTKTSLVKAQTERLPNYPEWRLFSFFYEPVQTDSSMEINLEAPFTNDPLGTKVLYDDLKVYGVFPNNLFFFKRSEGGLTSPKITLEKISPVEYKGKVEDGRGPHVIVFAENYSKDWEITLTDRMGQRVKVDPKHFSANLFANAWFVEGAPSPYIFQIYYKPQRLFNLGIIISFSFFALSFLLFVRERLKQ